MSLRPPPPIPRLLKSFPVPIGEGRTGVCSLRRYQCLPSLGRQEILQIHYRFLCPSIAVFQNGPTRGSFSPQNKVDSVLESEGSATPSAFDDNIFRELLRFAFLS